MENNDEIRKAGDYEITHSIHIGDRELVMGENRRQRTVSFTLSATAQETICLNGLKTVWSAMIF